MENLFLKNAVHYGVQTENGAKSYATTGKAIIDQFGKAGAYMGRNIDDVWTDQAMLWAEDPTSALRFPFYLRMITRQTNVSDGKKTETVQRGQGLRDESFKRLLWIAKYHPDEFYRNLWLVPIVGSWKDLWVLMSMDEHLNHEAFFNVIANGIKSESERDLVKKYLPRIRSQKKCTTEWAKKSNELAKEFVGYVGWTYSDYRKFKSTGKAHEFQRIICSRKYKNIDWKQIPGKALLKLVNGKFLSAHNLEDSYVNWLKAQPVAKFNGYPYELGAAINGGWYNIPLSKKITVDKQFKALIETAKKDGSALKGNVLCALDTSGSMNSYVNNNVTAYDVCVSLGIYFSELNEGAFHNHVVMFDDTSTLLELKGEFTDKWQQIKSESTAWGSTNLQSIYSLLIETRKEHPEIPIEEFPSVLLVVSDFQFNATASGKTNNEEGKDRLREVFPDEYVDNLTEVWWYCSNRHTSDVPATMEMGGQYVVSGFDGSIITLLLGGTVVDPETGENRQLTMEESVEQALNQEVLQLVQ